MFQQPINIQQERGDAVMAMMRWSPWSEVSAIRSQLNQLFDEMTEQSASVQPLWKPAVELQDNGESLTLKAELPGIEGKDLDISITREAVMIRGEHRAKNQTENKGYFRSEFRYGKFERVVGLPVPVQNDKVEAHFNNGILTLTLPKTEAAKNQVVKVNLAEADTTPNQDAAQTESK